MISQVLADFVGQIKANINTEIQMRTRDEGDLARIKEKYGGEVLQGLVKASVGSGMVENPTYNRAGLTSSRSDLYYTTLKDCLTRNSRNIISGMNH